MRTSTRTKRLTMRWRLQRCNWRPKLTWWWVRRAMDHVRLAVTSFCFVVHAYLVLSAVWRLVDSFIRWLVGWLVGSLVGRAGVVWALSLVGLCGLYTRCWFWGTAWRALQRTQRTEGRCLTMVEAEIGTASTFLARK